MRAVLDTNVFISGLFWRGNPFRCIQAAEAGLYELISADEILEELLESSSKNLETLRKRLAKASLDCDGLRRMFR